MLDIVSAVSIFVVGQFILKSIIEPIQELKKEIAVILGDLIFYANIYSNPGTAEKEVIDKASNVLRKYSSELIAKSSIIPFYNLWYYLRLVPSYKDIENVSSNLIGLSNSLYSSPSKAVSNVDISENNRKNSDEIQKLLTSYYSKIPINQLLILFILIVIFVFSFLSYKDKILEIYCDKNNTIKKSNSYDFNGSLSIHEISYFQQN